MSRKRRIPLSPGYHAEAGATKGYLHEIYTTIGNLHGYERIYVGSLMKEAVEAWAKTANDAEQPNSVGELLGLLDHVNSLVTYCSVHMPDVARYDRGAQALWAVVMRLSGDNEAADRLIRPLYEAASPPAEDLAGQGE